MSLAEEEAFEILELPIGTDTDTIRTSYKRLSMKCHPKEKNNNSTLSKAKFCLLSQAYRQLTIDDERIIEHVSMTEALNIYNSAWEGISIGQYNGYCMSNSDSSDDNDVVDDYNYTYQTIQKEKLHGLKNLSSPSRNQRSILSAEERNRNAQELISDEEREKRERQLKKDSEDLTKSEKKRLKKKKQREKRRLEKQEQEPPWNALLLSKEVQANIVEKLLQTHPTPDFAYNSTRPDPTTTQTKTENNVENTSKSKAQIKRDKKKPAIEEEIDPNAAFVSNALNKKKKSTIDQQTTNKKDVKPDVKVNGETEDSEELDAIVLRSRRVAIRGNEMAQSGYYTQAIELFTEAIKLDPTDFRFFGNRSYCFDRINNYDRALKDAEKAISLSVDWPKGYFRKGRAQAGLLQFAEAEKAFLHVLKLDKNCDDALQELQRVRVQQLIDMGFSQQHAEAGIRTYGTVQSALDSLLAGQENQPISDGSVSEDEPSTVVASPAGSPTPSAKFQPAQTSDRLSGAESIKVDPSNPLGYRTLWVGNVLPEVTEKKLTTLFGKFGSIISVRCLPDKYCAFINYASKESAGKAMTSLQGTQCLNQRLLIKYPDNPIENGVVLRGGSATTKAAQKQSGPARDGECYFWRTTGCQFGDKCHYIHDPNSRGIDKKPWQKMND